MIWVIGGTKDSRIFLEKFTSADKNIVVTTATEYGGKLLEGLPVKVVSEKLPLENMRVFIERNSINMIIDISHPYAFEVSKNAMKVAEEFSIVYYRFEREEIHIIPDKFTEFENIEDLINYCDGLNGNILVTLGSNNIEHFSKVKELKKFYFRILPKWDMVKKCENNGILPKNIIAMQGPFSLNMNKAMIEQLNIEYLVTKKGGDTGGEREKIDACNEKGIEVILLDKPKIKYPNCYRNIDELIKNIIL
ncbi:cobalt-precorrin-6A reductase [Fusobacterium varium]|uniref:cobalt-precorrin-6A reductase n=1 Tax=Fusobacterium varium TaxID=856 RepID=UPI000E41618B|nr:cobalt-precorrin-6A reductase [Fusobacterium varium]MCI6033990.1 cobalt-precorrin-6A reductase [Fusobacterium varium]RGJ31333.1 cobalt-precorrin-6A reductase [Fusobacterium varium]